MVRENDHFALRSGAHDHVQGFTLVELMTVVVIVGVCAAFAFPSMSRFVDQQEAKSSVTKIAGVLEEARSRAVTEATPHLVYVSPKADGESGHCGTAVTVVRDSDRSYSITDGDQLREIKLDPKACKKVELFGEGEGGGSAEEAEVPLPSEDRAVRGLGGLLGGVTEIVQQIIDPNQPGASEGAPRNDRVSDTVVNGATFPIDAESGRPVIAFSERGIPVDPANPTRWGSGAGAVYLKDKHATVYAAVVQPMGGVNVRVFDPGTSTWR